jgi:hypothetical protein
MEIEILKFIGLSAHIKISRRGNGGESGEGSGAI